MAFPQSVLPLRVRIAPGGQPAANPASWVWVDITQWVRVASGVRIETGKKDEGARVDAGKATLTIDNRDGRFSTRNVLGPWFGRLQKGTPLRVGTIAVADSFTRSVTNGWGTADSGQSWAITGSAADWSVSSGAGRLSVTAANTARAALIVGDRLLDVDAQFAAAVPAVMTGASYVIGLMVRYIDSSNYYMLSCEFNPAGTITAKIRRFIAGAETSLASLVPVPALTYTAGQKMRTRVQADGPSLRLKIWADGGAEPAAWTLTATDNQLPNAGQVAFYLWCVNGNTNTKPFTASVDDLEVEAVEFTGTVPEWPPRWDKSRRDATTTISAAGILRRLQQGRSPLRGPIVRMLLRNNPVAVWGMDDDSQATVASGAKAGTLPANARAAEFGQESPPLLGAKQTAGITASTVFTGRVPGHASTGTWGCVFFAYLVAPPAANTRIFTIASTGAVRIWAVELDSTAISLRGYDIDGTQVIYGAVGYSSDLKLPGWIAFDVKVAPSGGNVEGTIILYGVAGQDTTPIMWLSSGTTAGVAGSPLSWRVEGSLGFNEGRLGPVSFFNYEPPFVTYAFANAANGYVGEAAAARVARLCAEENVQVVVESGASEPLGPQRTDTFLNLLYAAETADLGVLYERGAGLGYRPRGARYNPPVDLALDFAAGDVAEPPEPTDDDQQLRNMWTVSRDNGSSAVALSQSSIDQFGLLDDSVTINVASDGRLPDHANFRLALTTLDSYRWPSIALNLARNTSQIAQWRATRAFPRLTIANEPTQVIGNAVDLVVLGYSMNLGPYDWDIELNCEPSAPWLSAIYGTSRYGSASCTTNSTLPASAGSGVSLTLKVVNPKDVWSTTAAGYQLLINGEVMTVTAMGAASGTAPNITQVATVTRAVNGIVIAHAIGEQVQINPAPRYAL